MFWSSIWIKILKDGLCLCAIICIIWNIIYKISNYVDKHMVPCIIQERYFLHGNLHLHQNLSLKIIYIHMLNCIFQHCKYKRYIYFILGFILSRLKIRPKIFKMVTQYMYLHLLRKFPSIHQKIDYSSLLLCMTKQKSTLSKSRPNCRGTTIWIIPIVSQTAEQAEWEWEKEIEKGQREREKTIDIYTCTLIYTYVNQLSLRFNISKI